jgi:hypothetical protein
LLLIEHDQFPLRIYRKKYASVSPHSLPLR